MAVRNIRKAYLYDLEKSVAENLATELTKDLNLGIEVESDYKRALADSDICVTCTPSTKYLVSKNVLGQALLLPRLVLTTQRNRNLIPAC